MMFVVLVSRENGLRIVVVVVSERGDIEREERESRACEGRLHSKERVNLEPFMVDESSVELIPQWRRSKKGIGGGHSKDADTSRKLVGGRSSCLFIPFRFLLPFLPLSFPNSRL